MKFTQNNYREGVDFIQCKVGNLNQVWIIFIPNYKFDLKMLSTFSNIKIGS